MALAPRRPRHGAGGGGGRRSHGHASAGGGARVGQEDLPRPARLLHRQGGPWIERRLGPQREDLLLSLGGCDAFISHSWHDDGAAKFNALSAWASAFEAEHRRPPIVWLDKASIDQDDIEASLSCLPVCSHTLPSLTLPSLTHALPSLPHQVYLAGCKQLLVLAGPTYVERLWCIVEVFTYLRMGGSPDRMVVVPLAGQTQRLNFGEFDAEKAKCFSPEDKRKLLQAITMAFGSCEPFNALVRTTLQAKAEESVRVQVNGGAEGSGAAEGVPTLRGRRTSSTRRRRRPGRSTRSTRSRRGRWRRRDLVAVA